MNNESHVINLGYRDFPVFGDKRGELNSITFELTDRCNFNCAHCYINRAEFDILTAERELITEEITRIMDEAASLGCLYVSFTGGEPLLRDDFIKLYLHSRNLGMIVSIFTNASMLTREIVQVFKSVPPLGDIEISVYGMSKATYESVTRKRGTFTAAFNGIKMLLDCDVKFTLKYVLLPLNQSESEEFIQWAGKLDSGSHPLVHPMFLKLRGKRDSELKNRNIQRLRFSPEKIVQLLKESSDGYTRGMNDFCQRFIGLQGEELFACKAGTSGGCVTSDGFFQPCMLLRHPAAIYDIRNGSLKVALEQFFPEVRKIKPKNELYLERCANCFLKGLCEQCPANSWMEHGDLDSPVEYLCRIAHEQAVDLGLLEDGERAWEILDWQARIDNTQELYA